MDIKKIALKYALQNAAQFSGKANPGAVIGKIISENPDLRTKNKEVALAAQEAVSEVNKLTVNEQVERLKEMAPQLLEKKKAEKRTLVELKGAQKGKVVTRIPPEPSKYAHIGHAISFMINYLYAKKYEGKCILRFEDTNPELSKQEYVTAILEDLTYLGIEPDRVVYVSDDIEKMYECAEQLITQGHAYVCFCSVDAMRDNRHKGIVCNCQKAPQQESEQHWKKMLTRGYKPGEAVLRLKGDMESKNDVMRDPVLFRISFERHYRTGEKYVVWPLYDFENAVEDGLQKVSHIMRSIEFGNMRVELQNKIKTLLNLPLQIVIQYGRFNVTDALTQGREIRQLIEKKEVEGWDDPRLVTIKALARRGIQPETFSDLAVEVGLSATPTNIDWSVISALNRKYLDPSAKRYFFAENPQSITIEGAPPQKVTLKLHPSREKEERHFTTGTHFLIAEKDFYDLKKLKDGELVRLMDCLNAIKKDDRLVFDSLDVERYRQAGKKIIHWLADTEKEIDDGNKNGSQKNLPAEILMPSATIVRGLAESACAALEVGEIIQFTRFGFCRLEKKETDRLRFIYCHE